MKSDDLEFYSEFLRLFTGVDCVRILLSYPEQYIELLRENKKLKEKLRNYNDVVSKYGMELNRALIAEDKLRTVRSYLEELGIIIPNFKW